MKNCTKCGKEKSLSEFYRTKLSRDGFHSTCKTCSSEYISKWYSSNKEKIKSSRSAWRINNKEKEKISQDKYKEKNLEKIKAYQKQWRIDNAAILKENKAKWQKDNAEKIKKMKADKYAKDKPSQRKRSAEYYEKNSEKIKMRVKVWANKNPDVVKVLSQNRRAREKSSGRLSKGIEAKLFGLQKGKCACCRKPLGKDYHMDHIVPLARGGTNTDDNIQLLTAKCNMQKNAKDPIEFMQSRGFLL